MNVLNRIIKQLHNSLDVAPEYLAIAMSLLPNYEFPCKIASIDELWRIVIESYNPLLFLDLIPEEYFPHDELLEDIKASVLIDTFVFNSLITESFLPPESFLKTFSKIDIERTPLEKENINEAYTYPRQLTKKELDILGNKIENSNFFSNNKESFFHRYASTAMRFFIPDDLFEENFSKLKQEIPVIYQLPPQCIVTGDSRVLIHLNPVFVQHHERYYRDSLGFLQRILWNWVNCPYNDKFRNGRCIRTKSMEDFIEGLLEYRPIAKYYSPSLIEYLAEKAFFKDTMNYMMRMIDKKKDSDGNYNYHQFLDLISTTSLPFGFANCKYIKYYMDAAPLLSHHQFPVPVKANNGLSNSYRSILELINKIIVPGLQFGFIALLFKAIYCSSNHKLLWPHCHKFNREAQKMRIKRVKRYSRHYLAFVPSVYEQLLKMANEKFTIQMVENSIKNTIVKTSNVINALEPLYKDFNKDIYANIGLHLFSLKLPSAFPLGLGLEDIISLLRRGQYIPQDLVKYPASSAENSSSQLSISDQYFFEAVVRDFPKNGISYDYRPYSSFPRK